MNDTTTAGATNSQTEAAASESAPKTMVGNMDDLAYFLTAESAFAYLMKASTEYADFNTVPMVTNRCEIVEDPETGNLSLSLDEAAYTDSTRIAVKLLTKRAYKTDENGKQVSAGSVPTCIVVSPQPTLDSIISNPAARDWLQKIVDKELTHVMVRPLRDAENPEAMAGDIPATLEAFITTSRGGGDSMLDTFNAYWQDTLKVFADAIPQLAKLGIKKGDLRKAFESKGFASAYFSQLESYGPTQVSVFALMLESMIETAQGEGADVTLLQTWLDQRDEMKLDSAPAEAEIDLSKLMGALAAKRTAKSEPAGEPAAATDSATSNPEEGAETENDATGSEPTS